MFPFRTQGKFEFAEVFQDVQGKTAMTQMNATRY